MEWKLNLNLFSFLFLFLQRGSDELNMYSSSPNSMTGTFISVNTVHHHLKLEKFKEMK